jgi:hypothetical protein
MQIHFWIVLKYQRGTVCKIFWDPKLCRILAVTAEKSIRENFDNSKWGCEEHLCRSPMKYYYSIKKELAAHICLLRKYKGHILAHFDSNNCDP